MLSFINCGQRSKCYHLLTIYNRYKLYNNKLTRSGTPKNVCKRASRCENLFINTLRKKLTSILLL